MDNAAIIAVLFTATVESFFIIVGNIFTTCVFWKHRNKLKGTFFLLINLAVADLFVGFTALVLIGVFKIPGRFQETNFNSVLSTIIWKAFEISFSYASVFFLALISLERACALIGPLCHRVASTKVYINGAFFGVVSCSTCRDIDCASSVRHIGSHLLDNCSRLCKGVLFLHDLRVLSGNPNKT